MLRNFAGGGVSPFSATWIVRTCPFFCRGGPSIKFV